MAIQRSPNRKPSKPLSRIRTIRKFRLDHKKAKALDTFFRHPATLLLLGFALTAGLGGVFSAWQQSRVKEADTLRIEQASADAALAKLIQNAAEFESRWDEVGLAIKENQNTEDINEARSRAEEAFVHAKADLISLRSSIDRAFPIARQGDHQIQLSVMSEQSDSLDLLRGELLHIYATYYKSLETPVTIEYKTRLLTIVLSHTMARYNNCLQPLVIMQEVIAEDIPRAQRVLEVVRIGATSANEDAWMRCRDFDNVAREDTREKF